MLLAVFALAAGNRGGPVPARAAEQASSSRLFVENAPSGKLSRAANGDLTLQLTGVPTTLWFTDRPARESGVEDTAVFVGAWRDQGGFAKQPPNAVLEGRVNGVRRTLPVELRTARFMAESGTVEYTARPLPRAPGFYGSKGVSPKMGEGDFGSSTLFMDDSASPPACFVQWTIPNITNQGPNTWAGLQLDYDTGGTFSYTWGPQLQSASGGVLYSYVAPGRNIGATGPEQWHAAAKQNWLGGAGMVGGTAQFLAWFQPSPGATTATGSVLGAGARPAANAPRAFRGSCAKVDVQDSPPDYPFTVSFPPS